MNIANFTTVIAADSQRYVDQLQLTVPTWRKHRPEIFEHPLIVLFDWRSVAQSQFSFIGHDDMRCVDWPGSDRDFYFSGREKMLSAFVHLSAKHVLTKWWFKIDCDVVALGPADWIPEEPANEMAGVWRPWSYTKPAWQVAQFNAWADGHEELKSTTPIQFEYDPEKKVAKHRRMISKQSWTRATFSRVAASLLPWGRLPIASQDGYYSMLAARLNRDWISYDAKRMNWNDSRRLHKVAEMAAQAMSQ